ncbi:hypothetical protein BCEN4_450057 [Burkholderia cenocepacia]|nr:hypothetical protein BCEN4_450057 [Burkholderia cenocepacia]
MPVFMDTPGVGVGVCGCHGGFPEVDHGNHCRGALPRDVSRRPETWMLARRTRTAQAACRAR